MGTTELKKEIYDMDMVIDLIQNNYERPYDAISREVVSNALDIHKEKEIPDNVRIRLFVDKENTVGYHSYLSVTDFGGMTPDILIKCNTEFGFSTKRGKNYLGGFGIGAKCFLSIPPFYGTFHCRNAGLEFGLVVKEKSVESLFQQYDEDGTENDAIPFGDFLLYYKETTKRNRTVVTIPLPSELDVISRVHKGIITQLGFVNNLTYETNFDFEYRFSLHTKDMEEVNFKTEILYEDELIVVPNPTQIPYKTAFVCLVQEKTAKRETELISYGLINFNPLNLKPLETPIGFKMTNDDVDVLKSREGIKYTDKTINYLRDVFQKLNEKAFDIIDTSVKSSLDTLDKRIKLLTEFSVEDKSSLFSILLKTADMSDIRKKLLNKYPELVKTQVFLDSIKQIECKMLDANNNISSNHRFFWTNSRYAPLYIIKSGELAKIKKQILEKTGFKELRYEGRTQFYVLETDTPENYLIEPSEILRDADRLLQDAVGKAIEVERYRRRSSRAEVGTEFTKVTPDIAPFLSSFDSKKELIDKLKEANKTKKVAWVTYKECTGEDICYQTLLKVMGIDELWILQRIEIMPDSVYKYRLQNFFYENGKLKDEFIKFTVANMYPTSDDLTKLSRTINRANNLLKRLPFLQKEVGKDFPNKIKVITDFIEYHNEELQSFVGKKKNIVRTPFNIQDSVLTDVYNFLRYLREKHYEVYDLCDKLFTKKRHIDDIICHAVVHNCITNIDWEYVYNNNTMPSNDLL